MKKFPLEVVVSALHGVLLCKIDQVYEVLNFLTGDNLFTHQLPRAGKVCRIPVFKQHPFLKDIDVLNINRDNWAQKLADLKVKYPNEIELQPIANWTHLDPVEEMIDMKRGDENIIVV